MNNLNIIIKKIFISVHLLGFCFWGFAQDYLSAPKQFEKVLGSISADRNPHGYSVNKKTLSEHSWSDIATKERWYKILLVKAQIAYPDKMVDIRNMTVGDYYCHIEGRLLPEENGDFYVNPAVGLVVDLRSPENLLYSSLPKIIETTMQKMRQGSRVSLDQINVTNGIDREELKDYLISALLENGYRVVAKEYLQKLYEEQQNQKSGIYNESTTVEENNFSAVGYFLNVKVTEASVRVQAINVSTGEYTANSVVNY